MRRHSRRAHAFDQGLPSRTAPTRSRFGRPGTGWFAIAVLGRWSARAGAEVRTISAPSAARRAFRRAVPDAGGLERATGGTARPLSFLRAAGDHTQRSALRSPSELEVAPKPGLEGAYLVDSAARQEATVQGSYRSTVDLIAPGAWPRWSAWADRVDRPR